MAEQNGKTVSIKIDDVQYEVPAGMNLVDAAKWAAGNDIPVFCYHPKMASVGMCRVCLVELGSIQRDRETGEVLLDEAGEPQVRWFPTLQTALHADGQRRPGGAHGDAGRRRGARERAGIPAQQPPARLPDLR